MDKSSKIIRIITEVALFAAIGYILDEIQGAYSFSFTSGGSIGIAMLAVLIIAFRRGWIPGVLTGLIVGLLDFSTKAYVLHPAQVLLDYILPYALVGLGGLFKPLFERSENKKLMWLSVACIIGGFLKFLSHYFAGVIFWGDAAYFAWNLNYMNPWLYSLVYNIAYMGPCIILTMVALVLVYKRAPNIFVPTYKTTVENVSNKKTAEIVVLSIIAAGGLFLFVFYLIRYAQSYVWKESSKKFTFDKDSMILFLIGIFVVVFSINEILMAVKNKYSQKHALLGLGIIGLISVGYSLSKILEMYIDEWTDIKNIYWIWFSISFVLVAALISLFFYLLIKEKQAKKEETTLSN